MAVVNVFTDVISVSYSGNGKSVSSKLGTYSGTKDAGIATVIPAGSVNFQVVLAFPIANIQSMVIDASQNVTIKTNSTTAPGDTINLNANYGIFWGIGGLPAKPLSVDVTSFYVSNPGAVDCTFNVRVLYN